jgi:hypothetical protein
MSESHFRAAAAGATGTGGIGGGSALPDVAYICESHSRKEKQKQHGEMTGDAWSENSCGTNWAPAVAVGPRVKEFPNE